MRETDLENDIKAEMVVLGPSLLGYLGNIFLQFYVLMGVRGSQSVSLWEAKISHSFHKTQKRKKEKYLLISCWIMCVIRGKRLLQWKKEGQVGACHSLNSLLISSAISLNSIMNNSCSWLRITFHSVDLCAAISFSCNNLLSNSIFCSASRMLCSSAAAFLAVSIAASSSTFLSWASSCAFKLCSCCC